MLSDISKIRIGMLALPLSLVLFCQPLIAQQNSLFEMSLEELLKVKVITASRKHESLEQSPAFIEIISQKDLQRRGYKDLSYLLDDISGIQVTRIFGDNYFSTLWRGARHTVGSSHLLMIDGIKFNHLYNNDAEILAALPMSNIKHIEVVHGSASVAYGADAVVGIINIITNREHEDTKALFQVGENGVRVVDISHTGKWNNYRFNISGRYDEGRVDFSKLDNYRWTNPALLQNSGIWGEFASTDPKSSHYNKSLGFRLYDESSELALQYHELASGYGLKYTFDSVLPGAGLWREPEYSFHWKQQWQMHEDFSLNTLLRYRTSNIDPDSYFVESYLVTDSDNGQRQRLVDASYWESKNHSTTASTEVDWRLNADLTLLSGIEVEFKNLQKAYNTDFGPGIPPQLIELDNYDFPTPPSEDVVANNRQKTSQKSIYALTQYQISPQTELKSQTFHFGIRNDYHSEYGSETSIRSGYVAQWDRLTMKLFYGEAYQEPPARLLYGGWQGSGSDPELKPRNAKTLELSFNYKFENMLLSGNLYRMQSKDLFNSTETGAVNLGQGESNGGDMRLRYHNQLSSESNLVLWGAYSRIKSKEQSLNNLEQLYWHKVGDIAENTFHFGAYLTLTPEWEINLRGRYYGDRPTVETNEIEMVGSFVSADLNINYQPEPFSSLKFALDITNLFDKDYFHPGARSASASTTNPADFDENDIWIGSDSFYNAVIPQPGRELRLSFYWRL